MGLELKRPASEGPSVGGLADCLANASMRHSNIYQLSPKGSSNYVLGTQIFRWMSDGQYPVDVSRPETPDNVVRIDRTGYKLIRTALEWVLPRLLLIMGGGDINGEEEELVRDNLMLGSK